MPLELHPMSEADMEAYIDITWDSFGPGIKSLMYPNGLSEEAREHLVKEGIEDWRKHSDVVRMMKVVDSDLPDDDGFDKIVGVSKWRMHSKERSEEELDAEIKEAQEQPLPPGANAAVLEDFIGHIQRTRKEILGGRPYVLLYLLGTRTKHHRRGVGAMHLKWGLQKADELGLPAFLEASQMGRPLYERVGFEAVRNLPFDAKKHGSAVDMQHTYMLRPAKV